MEKERYIIVQRLSKAGLHAECLRYARLLCRDVCSASCEAQARAASLSDEGVLRNLLQILHGGEVSLHWRQHG